MAAPKPSWRRFLIAHGVTWAATGVGAGIHLLGDAVLEDKQRWMPTLEATPWVMVLVALAAFPLLVGWMAVSRPLRGAKRGGWIAALWVLSQLAATAGSAAAIVSTDGNWLFGSRLIDSMPMPGTEQTAYLYRTGFFCGYELYVRNGGSVVLDEVRKLDREDCNTRTEDAHLEWRAGKGVVLLDEHGELVHAQRIDLSGLWMGPH